jgi:hypothetical protein
LPFFGALGDVAHITFARCACHYFDRLLFDHSPDLHQLVFLYCILFKARVKSQINANFRGAGNEVYVAETYQNRLQRFQIASGRSTRDVCFLFVMSGSNRRIPKMESKILKSSGHVKSVPGHHLTPAAMQNNLKARCFLLEFLLLISLDVFVLLLFSSVGLMKLFIQGVPASVELLQNTEGLTAREIFRYYLPKINFALAMIALIFQTTMLYPWHMKLEREFAALQTEQNSKLDSLQSTLNELKDRGITCSTDSYFKM